MIYTLRKPYSLTCNERTGQRCSLAHTDSQLINNAYELDILTAYLFVQLFARNARLPAHDTAICFNDFWGDDNEFEELGLSNKDVGIVIDRVIGRVIVIIVNLFHR